MAPRVTPRVRKARASFPHVILIVRPAPGQIAGDFEAAAEALRTYYGAARLRVDPSGQRDVQLTFTIADALRTTFNALHPSVVGDLKSVEIGRREDGRPWRLAIGPHTLIAGCSAAGKGSVFWSVIFGLAPAVRAGHVRVHGIDLKGGMEVRMGDALFTTLATNAEEAVAVLEQVVSWMRERTEAYAGRLRSHTPSEEDPLHVVMIDELAALTAYCPDRDLQRRAELAISLLCSQGRAPGFMVVACLQDPRKEVIPNRGLFTQMVGLRLKDASETAMVLGDTALSSGALCHRILRESAGMGYVLPEDGGHPIRVRAGYVSDDSIRELATRFPTPTRVAVELLERSPFERPRSRERSRGAV
jgi:DNA segregation ATPase FtsK/SpoIIIE, S-DNA-T family